MLILVSIIRVGQSHFVKAPIDEDSVDRIMSNVHALAEFSERKALKSAFLDDTRQGTYLISSGLRPQILRGNFLSLSILIRQSESTSPITRLTDRTAFRAIVQVEEKKRAEKVVSEKRKAAVGVDDLFSIRQLEKKSEGQGTDEIGLDLDQAMGGDRRSDL
jgi:coatomer subunit beta